MKKPTPKSTPLVRKVGKHGKLFLILFVAVIAIVGLVIIRYGFAADNAALLSGVPEAFQKEASKPVGKLEAVSTCSLNQNTNVRTGNITGWAINRAKAGQPTEVNLYFDESPAGQNGKKFTLNTSLASPDIKAQYPSYGDNNRFSFAMPTEYYDGKAHTVTGVAIGTTGVNIGKLNFTCSVVSAQTTKPPTTSTPPTTVPVPTKTTGGTTTTTTSSGSTSTVKTTAVANPTVVSSVMKQFTKTASSAATSASKPTSSGVIPSSNKNLPTELKTVDLVSPTSTLSQADLNAIDKGINDLAPSELNTLSGELVIQPNIAADKGVDVVGYYLNNQLKFYSSKNPYNYTFDTTRLGNGAYRMDVVGYDTSGKQVVHLAQKFNVENHLGVWQSIGNFVTLPVYWVQDWLKH